MNENIFHEMVSVAQNDLKSINKYDAKDFLKDTAKRMLGRSVSNRDMLFWPAGMLLLGLSESYGQIPSGDDLKGDVLGCIISYIDDWSKSTDSKVSYVDDALAGLTILFLYKETGDQEYLSLAEKIYAFLMDYPKNSNGNILYNRAAGNDYIFADGAGEIAMFLSRYSAVKNDESALALAGNILTDFYKNAFDSRSGLIYHAYSASKNKKLGLLGWGRSCGWLIMGYSEYLINSASSNTALSTKIKEQFLEFSKTILSYQRTDGGYSWHLPAMESECDTSATAMIAYSFSIALSIGIYKSEGDKYSKAVLRAVDFIQSHTKNGSVEASLSGCEDLCVHRQIYGHFPWGQGAALALLANAPQMI